MTAAKAWVAFAGSIVTALTAALSDDLLDVSDTQQVVLTGVTALFTLYATWEVRNRPSE